MNSPAHDVALYLAALGVGTMGGASGWSVNAFREPDAPDTAVTVYDTGGPAPFPDIALTNATFQVRVRSLSYPDAYTKAEQIRQFLIQDTTREIGSHRYIAFWMTSEILAIGRDDADRHLLTANYRLERQPLSGG